MRVEHDVKLTFDDVLIRPKRSTLVSRSDVTLVRDFKFRHSDTTWTGVPIVAANMDTTGVFGVSRILQNHRMLTCLQKFYSTRQCSEAWDDGIDPGHVAITCGSTEDSLELLKKKMATSDELSMICVDVANGYREVFLDFIKDVRRNYPNSIVIAGNVATREMTEALILAGADVVKVGIGPGSVCTTRKVAGVGYPQLSAISECADAAHGLGGHGEEQARRRQPLRGPRQLQHEQLHVPQHVPRGAEQQVRRQQPPGEPPDVEPRADLRHRGHHQVPRMCEGNLLPHYPGAPKH